MANFPKIPNLSEQRRNKYQYTYVCYSGSHPLKDDELVNPNDYGIRAQTYYRAQMTPEQVAANPKMATPLLRKDIVLRLARANAYLKTSPDVKAALGFNCELDLRDCLRTLEMQQYAYDVYWPARLREQNPAATDEAITAMVPQFCAKPNPEGPHISGGSVDVALLNCTTDKLVNRGSGRDYPTAANFPDYWENYDGQLNATEIDSAVVMMRRVLYYALTEVAGLFPNPTEVWHFGRGDKLSAFMAGNLAYYQGV